MFFASSRLRSFSLIVNNMEKINTRKRNKTKSFSVQSVNVTLISFKCHRYIDNSIHWILSFYLVVKRLTITGNSVVKLQNLIVNQESQPITSNHVDEIKSIFHSPWRAIIWWKNEDLMKIADTNFKVAIFSDAILVSNYHGCKDKVINLIPHYLILFTKL